MFSGLESVFCLPLFLIFKFSKGYFSQNLKGGEPKWIVACWLSILV